MNYTLALPSKGAIAEPTDHFLRDCGLKVSKPNARQYTGVISSIPGLKVLFQRVKDVVYKVADGTVQLGITGYDVVCENPHEDLIVIHDKLGYGHCRLVIAVPEYWVDVNNIIDLADVTLDIREQKQRNIRIATTYPHMTRQFLHKQHIHNFNVVKAEGAIEAAPTIGYADIVVDLTQTGTTLRENHLKQIDGGTIVESQACLIANRTALLTSAELRNTVRMMCEFIDASLNARQFYQVTADIMGDSAESIAQRVSQNELTRGLLGPTVAPIYTSNTGSKTWHTVTLTIQSNHVLAAVEYLRHIGARHAIASPVKFIFHQQSNTFQNLLDRLELD